jgi:choline kinase
MGSLTDQLPKCMLNLCGITLLERCYKTLALAGFSMDEIGIVTGYRSDTIIADSIHRFHNEQWATTNMFFSLTKARPWLVEEPCLIVYSDIVFSSSTIARLAAAEGNIILPYFTGYWDLWSKRFANPLEDLESFKCRDGFLIDIGRKPVTKDEIEGQYMGLLKVTPHAWLAIEQSLQSFKELSIERLDMTTLLRHLIKTGMQISVFPEDDLWLECDSEKDITLYENIYRGVLLASASLDA